MKKKTRVGIVFGGKSEEHEVSLLSAECIINNINREKYDVVTLGITKQGQWLLYEGPVENIQDGTWQHLTKEKLDLSHLKEKIDMAFLMVHGPGGEDGSLQGLLESLNIPYTGSRVLGSALGMDKGLSKKMFEAVGIPVCNYTVVKKEDILYNETAVISYLEKKIGFPMFVKPVNLGSSVGISKAENKEALIDALLEAVKYDRKIIVEEFINCREIETGIIGNDNPKVAGFGEIITSKTFYTYEAKYLSEGVSKVHIPASIDPVTAEKMKDLALKAYKAIECAGFARIDFFLDRDTNQIFLNEINTIPGFTKHSMFPMLWEKEGLSTSDLIDQIIKYGFEFEK